MLRDLALKGILGNIATRLGESALKEEL